MPNWCRNRVTASGDEKQISKIAEIFSDKKSIFNHIIQSPDWSRLPNEDGEFPVPEEHKNADGEVIFTTSNFPKSGKNDDRWYHWNIQNWGTKWDITADSVDMEHIDSEILELEFDTAWSPPEEICYALRERFEDVNISWFYDEPGMEVAGYL